MRPPRGIGAALRQFRERAAPATLLAAVQAAWAPVAGERIAGQAEPVAERGRVVTVACRTAVWAQELDMLQGELIERLNENAEVRDHGGVAGLRFTADAARHLDRDS